MTEKSVPWDHCLSSPSKSSTGNGYLFRWGSTVTSKQKLGISDSIMQNLCLSFNSINEACIGVLGIQDICHFTSRDIGYYPFYFQGYRILCLIFSLLPGILHI